MASREGKCPCLSQTNDSIVFCQKDEGHDGLHHWQDPVHPGHSKAWGGNVTTIETSTQHRFVSPRKLVERCGVFADNSTGRARYAPMMPADSESSEGVEFAPEGFDG